MSSKRKEGCNSNTLNIYRRQFVRNLFNNKYSIPYTSPWSSIAPTTFSNPAILAPFR